MGNSADLDHLCGAMYFSLIWVLWIHNMELCIFHLSGRSVLTCAELCIFRISGCSGFTCAELCIFH